MPQESGNRFVVFGVFVVLVAVGVFAFVLLKKPDPKPEVETVEELPAPAPVVEHPVQPVDAGTAEPPPDSPVTRPTDAQVREWAEKLSGDTAFSEWVKTRHLMGKFVAIVENISTGQSPRKLLTFMEPEGQFAIRKVGEKELLDPEGYKRYDLVVAAFASLDTERCAWLYRKLYPWMNRKYREMAKPDDDFRGALTRAMAELLRVPAVEDDIRLLPSPVMMKMASPELEAMSPAQKHLFRMGPANIRKVQAKLRELGRATGIATELAQVQPIEYTMPVEE